MVSGRLHRFVVVGDSMLPKLRDGDLVIARPSRRARPGQLRVVEHPHRPGMWLVKRVETVRDDGHMTVMSDNPDSTRADSRTFGHLPVAGSLRVLFRVRRR